MRATMTLGSAIGLLAGGCLDTQRYVTADGPGPDGVLGSPDDLRGGLWTVAMTEDTPPFFTSMDGDIFIIEQRVQIPFREPNETELMEMGDITDIAAPYPYGSRPFIRRDDVGIQIDWTISNISDEIVDATVTINGINEFHEYVPGVTIVEDTPVADYAQWERVVRLEGGQRLSWTTREEELDEVAVDLATVVNGAMNANQVVYFENHSSTDYRSQPFIPQVIPGLMGMRIGLRTTAALPIVLEASVRVHDTRGVVQSFGNPIWPAPQPAIFTPMPAMPVP
ncbi:MAG: hypothetical protein IT378_09730 [Sandaracinaceae bacterium]|nr:hypothetical protein [Sandaracinaceae bacterium]